MEQNGEKLATDEEILQYKKLKNQIRRLTRKSKKILEKEIAKNSKSNPKAFWKYTQSKLKTRAGIPDLMMPGGILKSAEGEPDLILPGSSDKKYKNYQASKFTCSDQEKADLFSTYFESVFTKEPDSENLPIFEKRNYTSELNTIEITADAVKKKLTKIKVNKSPGPDSIHPRVLKEISDTMASPIATIFSTSLRNKELPDEWKSAKISAIYKKGNKTDPLNYRPVSLTCVLCKIMESIIRDHVIKHMKTNNLFSAKQFGFISGRSTTLQLLHVLNIWTDILDQGGSIDAIYCDFMKAFDKVPHKRLSLKVDKYGITGNALG